MVFSCIKSTKQFEKIIEKETNLKGDEAEVLVRRILSLFLVNEPRLVDGKFIRLKHFTCRSKAKTHFLRLK
jgi:hypothetical protein